LPKEITHWKIALTTLSKLEHTAFRRILEDERASYLSGSVLPDMPYYYLTGPKRREMLVISESLHCEHGEDSFENPARFYNEAINDNMSFALLAGYLTHIAVDSIFHPFVYAFTGCEKNTMSPFSSSTSRYRHFMLESRFDFYNMRVFPIKFDFRIKSLLREIDKNKLAENISRLFFTGKDRQGEVLKLLRRQAAVQALFFRPVLRLFRFIIPDGFSAAFYPLIRKNDELYSKSFEYLHPVTGRKLVDSYLSLEKKAVELSLKWLVNLAGGICFWENEPGPSLTTGLPLSRMEEMRFFQSDLTINDVTGL